jgi:hypothetical protein
MQALLGESTTAEVIAIEAALIAEAEAQSGLSDWGIDQSFRTGLKVYIADMLALPRMQAGAMRPLLVSLLVQRLTLIEDARREPGILAEDVGQPVFILGLPRGGTSYTHALLALDPAARAPLVWEAAFPSPPTEAATFDSDPRIARLGASMEEMMGAQPELRQSHMMRPVNESECEQFMEMQFASNDLWASFDVRRHARWLAAGASQGYYAWHRRMLQQFQWHGPRGRWTLKSPDHIFRVPALLDAYPNACIVQTHRDPAKTLPSQASLILTMRRLVDPDCDPRRIGPEVVEVWTPAFDYAVANRHDPKTNARILDIAYAEVVGDPVGAVQRIHRHFDLPFSAAHEARIRERMAQDEAERVTPHRYTAEDFGIDAAMTDFPAYREVFGDLF